MREENTKEPSPVLTKDSEDILFRIWLYKSRNKWSGVIDLMRLYNSVFIDAIEALLFEDIHHVIRLKNRGRGKDIPEDWYPLIESCLLSPFLTQSITPFAGHIFGQGRLVTIFNLKYRYQEKVIKDLEIISPSEYAKRCGLLYFREWPDNYYTKRKVFLCHATPDKTFVRKLESNLKENNIDVWVDHQDILAWQEFIPRIEHGITKCDFVIVIMTPNFIKGPWANRELQIAINREISENRVKVIPLLKKDCDIPEILKIKSYVDFRGRRFENGMDNLIRSINELPITAGQ